MRSKLMVRIRAQSQVISRLLLPAPSWGDLQTKVVLSGLLRALPQLTPFPQLTFWGVACGDNSSRTEGGHEVGEL